jgi:endonuclease/exonuclease/phosphatase family metal-dependent hydrolase
MNKPFWRNSLFLINTLFLGIILLIPFSHLSSLIQIISFVSFIATNSVLFCIGLLHFNKLYLIGSISGFFLLIVFFPGLISLSNKDTIKSSKEITIMSYNLNYLRSIFVSKDKKEAKSFDAFKAFMQSVGTVPVLCVQETSSISYRPIASQLNYPYYFGHKGTMIFSKEPFKAKGYLTYPHTTDNSCTWVNLAVNNKIYRFYSVHLESNKFAYKWKELARTTNVIERIFSLLKYWDQAEERRLIQAQIILNHIEESPYPTVVTGDFNAPPFSKIYSLFSKKLSDTFIENSVGLGQTYTKIPGLRIDYLFKSPFIRSLKYRRPKVDFSDHYPILIDLEL